MKNFDELNGLELDTIREIGSIGTGNAATALSSMLGCEVRKIRNMFLVEAGAIGLLGGVIGVALSYAASAILNNLTMIAALFGGSIDLSGLMGSFGGGYYYGMDGGSAAISMIPPWLVLLGLGFSTLVGVLSGLWPAIRATKISALEAIRHE